MTRKVFLISETSAGFHDKLTQKTWEAFHHGYCDVQTWTNMAINRESFPAIYNEGCAIGADIIHVVRLLNPTTLLNSLKGLSYHINPKMPKFSFLLMGLSEQLRVPEKISALIELSNHPLVHKIVLMSIDPVSCFHAGLEAGLNPEKIAPLHEPPYEERDYYRNVSQEMARVRLGMPLSSKMVLYFGTYFFSKGPDIALEAAKMLPEIDFYFVGDTKLGSIEINPSEYTESNIHFYDSYVSEGTARDFFRAANVIQMPYRKFYQHDTSGIFNQAMVAQRLVVVPNFPPFSSILSTRRMNVGAMFDAEDAYSLAREIKECVVPESWPYHPHFDAYLNRQTKWDDIAKEVLK